jgi:endonuclease YncB( thermonuclease family)
MWFIPNNQDHLIDLGDRQVEYNGGGFVQLRFEGIDALELHYNGPNHQITPHCYEARDQLLELAGFIEMDYAPNDEIETYVRESNPENIDGYILSRNVDPFGRPVSFVFTGIANDPDGSEIWLTPDLLENSLNAQLASIGHAYPTFYTGLPTDLRNRIILLATNARNNNLGLWQVDESRSGIQIQEEDDLEQFSIWPKLYRRLFSYFSDVNNGLANFEEWLREDRTRDDELWIISRAELGNVHDIIEIEDNIISLNVDPEDIIIVPR